jgi:hypothetical protein
MKAKSKKNRRWCSTPLAKNEERDARNAVVRLDTAAIGDASLARPATEPVRVYVLAKSMP